MTRNSRSTRQRIVAPAGDPPPAADHDEDDDDAGDTPPSAPQDFGDIGDVAQLADPTYTDWTWWVYRVKTREEQRSAPRSKSKVVVTKLTGPLDVIEIQKQYGGGVYEFWGFHGGALRIRQTHELDGPRKVWDQPSSVTPSVTLQDAAAAPSRTDALLERLLEKLSNPPAPAPAPQSLTDQLTAVVQVAKMLQPPAPASTDQQLSGMLELFRQGVEMGTKREPGEGGTDWAAIIDKGAPVVEKLVGAMLAGRPRRPAPPPAQRRSQPPSSAEVIADPPPPEPTEDQSSPGMAAVVAALARAVDAIGTEDEIPPDDFAATVATVLEPRELSLLCMGSTDQLMAELEAVAHRFPVFAPGSNQAARTFVEAVLGVLRSPPE